MCRGNLLKEICDKLHDLVPLVEFKKRKKHPWMSVTFSKVDVFHIFLNCTNGTKSYNTLHIVLYFNLII